MGIGFHIENCCSCGDVRILIYNSDTTPIRYGNFSAEKHRQFPKELIMDQNSSESKAQIVYFSHGGGPLPILGDASHKAMIDFMTRLPARLKRPEAILVISAHWEETAATLLSAPNPPMFYDYYGFPDEAYRINYPAPGSPELANRIAGILKENNIPAQLDPRRGFDHGLFIPLKMMYPQADIPSLQLSLLRGLNAAAHIALGKALRALMNENILVIGSGFSFHNLRAFGWEGPAQADPANDAFQDWLIETCTGPLAQSAREQRLTEWQKAPSARYCHPREEHLLPVHVCAAMAGRPGELVFDDMILRKRSVAFLW
jgi:4,5-DOPA dioxygenase extradiol